MRADGVLEATGLAAARQGAGGGRPAPGGAAGVGQKQGMQAGSAGTAGPAGGAAEVVRRLEGYLQGVQRELRFEMDEEAGRTVVRVVDAASGEVIRQIPPEEMLAAAKALEGAEAGLEGKDGLLVRTRA